MRMPRWVVVCLVVAPVGVALGVLTIVLFDTKIALKCGMALALGSLNIGLIALNRLDRITREPRS